jgi:hypothetical protein
VNEMHRTLANSLFTMGTRRRRLENPRPSANNWSKLHDNTVLCTC